MSEIVAFLQDWIARAERDRAASIAKAEEFQVKATELTNKARELDVLIRHLKHRQDNEAGGNSAPFPPASTGPKVPVRSLVRECLTEMDEFTSGELVAAVQARNQDARRPSVHSELSHAKARGEVVAIGKDHYKSNLFRGLDVARTGNVYDYGDTDEPEDDFGTISSAV